MAGFEKELSSKPKEEPQQVFVDVVEQGRGGRSRESQGWVCTAALGQKLVGVGASA